MNDFDKFFSFKGCGTPALQEGVDCYLRFGEGRAGVHVQDVSARSFTLVSLPGHPEGTGNVITFSLATDSKGFLRLNVVADGPGNRRNTTKKGSELNRKLVYHFWYYFHSKIERSLS